MILTTLRQERIRNVDRNEVNVMDCSSAPTTLDRDELSCLFLFYLNGQKLETCFFFDEENFVFPVFRCPIRNITTKINGINSYTSQDFLDGDICRDADTMELNPNRECSPFERFRAFGQCKNNCRGGKKLKCPSV